MTRRHTASAGHYAASAGCGGASARRGDASVSSYRACVQASVSSYCAGVCAMIRFGTEGALAVRA